MNDSTFEQINQFFKKKEFQKIPTDSETVKMYATFQKSNLYLINVIQLSEDYKFDKEKYLHYREVTKKQFSEAHADKVILLNIILTEQVMKLYDVVNYSPELEEDFVDIQWLVDTKNNELIIPSKQIKHVLDIDKNLLKVISNQETKHIKLIQYHEKPVISISLIAINAFIWVVMEYKGSSMSANTLLQFGALYPPLVWKNHEYYRLFSSMFIHIGASHLLFNCFSIFIFGTRLEKYLKRSQFLIIYFLSGLFASVFSLATNTFLHVNPIAAGASGAIYGLVGSIVVYSKLSGKHIEGLSDYMLMIYFVVGMAFSFVAANIDTSAHIGGFIGGMLVTLVALYLRSDGKTTHYT